MINCCFFFQCLIIIFQTRKDSWYSFDVSKSSGLRKLFGMYVCMYICCMYVCMYVCCIYLRMYVCMYVCTYVVCMYVCMYVCCIYVCMLYVCMYVCMYVCCIYLRMYVCMYVHKYVCIYVCTYVCMYVRVQIFITYIRIYLLGLKQIAKYPFEIHYWIQKVNPSGYIVANCIKQF